MSLDQERLKEKAALSALSHVRSGMRLGLGTGSTVRWFVDHLGAALSDGRLSDVAGVPTSTRTNEQCRSLGIRLVTLSECPVLDLAVDGADEVDPSLDLIKGLGGALLREKMVANAAREFIVIADQTKDVLRLGTKSPLPVEVVRFEWRCHLPFLESLGAVTTRRLTDEGPFVTDNGNYILDCHFEGGMDDPAAVADALERRSGIVDHGLFLNLCTEALIATPDGVAVRERAR